MRPLCCVSAVLTCVPLASTTTVSPIAADLEHEIADRQALAGAEDDVLPLERAETLQRDPDGVSARLQVGDLKISLRIADRLARLVGGFGDDRDGGAGNDLALRVGDGPGDGPGDGLGGHEARHHDCPGDQEHEQES